MSTNEERREAARKLMRAETEIEESGIISSPAIDVLIRIESAVGYNVGDPDNGYDTIFSRLADLIEPQEAKDDE